MIPNVRRRSRGSTAVSHRWTEERLPQTRSLDLVRVAAESHPMSSAIRGIRWGVFRTIPTDSLYVRPPPRGHYSLTAAASVSA
jgi:hypothetical protein